MATEEAESGKTAAKIPRLDGNKESPFWHFSERTEVLAHRLLVGGREFWVNAHWLGAISPVLRGIFFGLDPGAYPAGRPVIQPAELKDESADDFLLVLQCVSVAAAHREKTPTVENFGSLIRLADKLQIEYLLNKISTFVASFKFEGAFGYPVDVETPHLNPLLANMVKAGAAYNLDKKQLAKLLKNVARYQSFEWKRLNLHKDLPASVYLALCDARLSGVDYCDENIEELREYDNFIIDEDILTS